MHPMEYTENSGNFYCIFLLSGYARSIDQRSIPHVTTLVVSRDDGSDPVGSDYKVPVPKVSWQFNWKHPLLGVILRGGSTDGHFALHHRLQIWEVAW